MPENSKESFPRCGAKKKNGEACRWPAGRGTDHPGIGCCSRHGGSTPNANKHAARLEAQMASAKFMLAGELSYDTDPTEALLYVVGRSRAVALYAQWRVSQVVANDEVKDGQVNLWARTELDALDRLARFSKMALDAGVAERRLRMAESQAAWFAQAFDDGLRVIAEALGEALTDALRMTAVRAFSSRLALLEAQADPGVIEGTAAAA